MIKLHSTILIQGCLKAYIVSILS